MKRTIAIICALQLGLCGLWAKDTLTVALDGSGDFTSINEAIAACPDYEHEHITTIHIKAGVYREEVVIPANKQRLHIKGDGPENTLIVYGKYAEQYWPGTEHKIGTSGSATLYVHADYVTFEDLSISNDAGEGKEIGQAVAVFTNGDFIFFHRCCLLGNQDTLYTFGRYNQNGGLMRAFFLDCYIEGTTDFIFGPSTVLFRHCVIHQKKNSYVTAASTPEGEPYGYVFENCRLTADEGVTKSYLGRPWRSWAKTVFVNCYLGAHILPEGWHDWEKPGKPNTKERCYYAEYGSYGPGAASAEQRVPWSHQLTAEQAADYSFERIFSQTGDPHPWNPFDNR